MRFGEGFHRLIIPEFESFYIDYNCRKASIKQLHIQGQGLDSAYQALWGDQSRIEDFRNQILASVLDQEKEMIDSFYLEGHLLPSLPAASASQNFSSSQKDTGTCLGISNSYAGLTEPTGTPRNRGKQEAQEIQWFKLYDGSEEKTTAVSLRITTLLAELDGARIEHTPDPQAVPLKETPWRFGSASDRLPNIGTLHHLVLQGNAEKLVQLARPDYTFDFGIIQLDQVIRYLVLNKLEATAIQVLERSPEFAQSLNKDCLLFSMRVATSARASDEGSAARGVRRREDELLEVFQRMMQLCPSPTPLFLEPDGSGLELLSYAAKLDLIRYCETILSLGGPAMRPDWVAKLMRSTKGSKLLTPFEIMLHRHQSMFTDVITCLCEDICVRNEHDIRCILDGLLTTAVRVGNDEAVRCLVDVGAGISSQSTAGQASDQNALHIAALQGRVDYVNLLLANSDQRNEMIDATEPRRGLTALAISCMYGHEGVVKALLLAGADVSTTDRFGWTAKEHAAYRGHQTIAGLLGAWDRTILQGGPANSFPAMTEPTATSLGQGEHAIIVNLGSVQAWLKVDPVETSCYSPSPAAAAKEDTSYSLTISAPQESQVGKATASMIFDLPLINDDLDTTACVFMLKDDAVPVLTFRITACSRLDPSQEKVVGIGSAVLEGIKLAAGCPRENLVRERTAAILDCDTMNVIGTVLFTFVRATPYPYLQDPLPSQKRQSSDGMILVGHRGLGQNVGKDKYLQIGENTIQSFLAAAKLGASFVEVNLQLTRDLEAVSYHDLSFSESGTDILIHDLTLEQFRYASNVQSPHGNPASVIGSPHNPTSVPAPRPHSRSVSERKEPGASQVQDRVKHTVDFRAKGFKPNTRGEFIHDSLVTLEEILRELPEHVGLNIEFKHPRIHESVIAGVAPVVIEINKFIDVALDKIRPSLPGPLHHHRRPAASRGLEKPPPSDLDKRAASVQTAVHFARRWRLAGVVFAAEPFLLCPRLVRFVKNAGLLCETYGPQNNEVDNVK
ncbi:ankyrin repeat-containing protein, partial [Apiospora phragmitis]